MTGKMRKVLAGTSAVVAIALSGSAFAATTLEAVKQRGHILCGVSTGLAGFSMPDEKGGWQGIDIDSCHALAAAVFGDPSKVRFTPLTTRERFTALQSGEIDVLERTASWTLTRDASLGINFAVTSYYDGQGFLVKKELGVKSAKELDGATVCIQAGTTTELNLADYFRTNGMKYNTLVFDTADQTVQAFESGRCDMLTSDASQLAGMRSKLPDPSVAMILPELISKEPLSIAVRQGDDQWFNIVKWVFFAQLNAEELGVTQANVDQMKSSDNPEIQRLLGVSGEMGQMLGLSQNWAYDAIKHVGNYGEMFERNMGEKTPLGLPRGLNALWNQGGVMYAPPVR